MSEGPLHTVMFDQFRGRDGIPAYLAMLVQFQTDDFGVRLALAPNVRCCCVSSNTWRGSDATVFSVVHGKDVKCW